MQLPKIVDSDPAFQLLQTKWKSILDPLLAQPLSSNSILKNVKLAIGDNVINHLLGRTMQGWIISDINSVSDIYRNAPLNSLTLTLNASAVCTVDIVVF